MTNLELYKAAQDKIEEARAEARRIGKLAFREGADALFETFPDLISFGWAQYTPYFNDGEPCNFSVYYGYPDINGEEYSGHKEHTYKDYRTGQDVTVPDTRTPEGEAVKEFLKSFSKETFEELFGDHVKVTVQMSGDPIVEEYDHE